LVQRYGEERVFFDREDIGIGDNWRETIRSQLQQADVVYALIGRSWLIELQRRAANAEGDDVLRFEIGEALAQGKRLIPVLVDGADMPPVRALPADLLGLSERQAAALAGSSYESDLRQLLASSHVPWVLGLAWALSTMLGWFLGLLGMVLVLMVGAWTGGHGLAGLELGAAGTIGQQAWPSLGWFAAAGIVLGLAVAASQWLILRAWLPISGRWLFPYAVCGLLLLGMIALAHGWSGQESTGIGASILALMALPFGFGLLLWAGMRPHLSRAGWFSLVHHGAPLLGMLLVAPPGKGAQGPGAEGLGPMLGVCLGALVSGACLVWLLRRAGVGRR
jgi:hypothetical protein